jgi:acyl carrier protein
VSAVWSLYRLSAGARLDHLVLLVSPAALLGDPAAPEAVAAQALTVALASHRRSLASAGMSVVWDAGDGGRDQSGEPSRPGDRSVALVLRGGAPVPEVLDLLLRTDLAAAGVSTLDLRQWIEAHPPAAMSAYLERLIGAGRSEPVGDRGALELREQLMALEPVPRALRLQRIILDELARITRLAEERIDVAAPLQALGVDSHMGMELRNRLESRLGMSLAATMIWTYPSAQGIAGHLGELLDNDGDAGVTTPDGNQVRHNAGADGAGRAESLSGQPLGEGEDIQAALDRLSDDELLQLGRELLE